MSQKQAVPLEELDSADQTWCTSVGGNIDLLKLSIEKAGQLTPVVLARGDGARLQILHGFRRVRALGEMNADGVLAKVVGDDMDEIKRAFENAFWENLAGRGFNLAEKAVFIRIMSQVFGAADREIADRYLGVLGLPPSQQTVSDLIELSSLPSEWLSWMAQKDIPFGVAGMILGLDPNERDALKSLVVAARPGRNLLRELIPLLKEVSAREGTAFSSIIEESLSILNDGQRNPPAGKNADALISYLRRRRYPDQQRLFRAIEKLGNSLRLPPGIDMEKTGALDPPRLSFTVTADSLSALEERSRALSEASRSVALEDFFRRWG